MFILARADDDGASVAEHLMAAASNSLASASQRIAAQRALDVPELPSAWGDVFGDFVTLDRRRPPAFAGLAPIPIGEIVAFGNALRFGYAAHEIEALIELDAIRMRTQAMSFDDAMNEVMRGD